MPIVVGVDPDSDKLGVAIYKNQKLFQLRMMRTREIVHEFLEDKNNEYIFAIENVASNNFLYSRNKKYSQKVKQNIQRSTGRCQQSQKELIDWLEFYKVKYYLVKPAKSNWASNSYLFTTMTGWKKRSNKDTRSASYFGFLYKHLAK